MQAKVDVARRFDDILEMLWDKDEKVREAGMRNLADFQKDTTDPGSQVGLKALWAAARAYEFPEASTRSSLS